jgi:hypothetical protein
MKKFNKGLKRAKKILEKEFGRARIKLLFKHIKWVYSPILPKEIDFDIPAKGWMGFFCPMTDGTYCIWINPEHHKKAREIAFTIGHEIAHIFQYVANGPTGTSHEGDIFELFRRIFCDALDYTDESF